MPFPENILDEDEHVVMDLRQHWRRVVFPLLLVPIVIGAASYLWFVVPHGGTRRPLRIAIFVVAVALLLWFSLRPYLGWVTTRYVVTSRRVIVRRGVISRNGRDVPLSRINDVSFDHTFIERLFGSGTLTVESAGERGQVVLGDVPHVERVQRDLYRLVEDETQRLR